MTANQKTQLHHKKSIAGRERDALHALTQAADTFVKHEDRSVQIWAASRDWFLEEWGRDTFISLPGLLLYTKRFDEAKMVFRRFAEYQHHGLIPNRITSEETLYNTVDASLWFIQALKTYLRLTDDIVFVKEMLPTLRNIVAWYKNGASYEMGGQSYRVFMDGDDGLIVSPPQATWMDANPVPNDPWQAITPRHGKAVEINALWYSGILFLAEIEGVMGDEDLMEKLNEFAADLKKSFNDQFWNEDESCLLDVVGGDPHQGAIRCNQIFAVSHGEDLLSKAKQKKVLNVVQKELLTPGGLRTLSPRDSHYHKQYDTYQPMQIKDQAYHQGTVWPWLIGAYCDALVKVHRNDKKSENTLEKELKEVVGPLALFCIESPYRSLPEVFSAEAPYEPGGTTSQAWSVAEVLRVMVQYGFVS